MGRMLDTMKQGEARKTPLAISKPTDAAPAQETVVDWEIGTEVPFIEVGGPNKKVELSPGLLKHPPQTAPQPPHLPTETPAPATAKQPTVYLTESKPMTATLEPWPAPAPMPLHVSADVIAYHQPEHPASKEYAILLDAIRGSLKSEVSNVVLFVGLKPGVGTSTVLLNLAVTASLQRKLRVAALDLGGGLAVRLGLDAKVGISDVLEGSVALDQALIKTGIGSLQLLTVGRSTAAITTEAMAWLLGWLRERHDLVLLHASAMDNPTAMRVHVPHASGIFLVLPQGEPSSSARNAAQSIAGMGGRLSGLIHTHFDAI